MTEKKRVKKRRNRIGQTILPKKIDGRTVEGRRLKEYALQLADEVPDSDDPIVRARILHCAALILEGERLTWRIAQGKHVDHRKLTRITYAIDHTLAKLQGKELNVGRPKANGSPASDTGPRARSLGMRLAKANGIDERFLT